MTEPTEPTLTPETTAAPEPTAAAFSATLNRPRFLRVGVVLSAGLVLLVSAALALAASPAPTGGTTPGATVPGANPPLPGKGGRGFGFGPGGFGPGGFGPSVFGGPGGGLGLKGAPRGGPGFGQISIASIHGNNLDLKTDDGWTRTIVVTGTTRITKGGGTIAIGDLKVGDAIRFAETRNADGSYNITAIQVVVPQVVGTVTGVTSEGFTLTSRKNATWTITVTGTTSYLVGGAAGTKADVTVGANVAVAGTQNGDSALTALTVRIELPRVIGKVTAKTADTITVQRLGGGTATIHVGSGTTYRVPGDTSPSLADIAVGAVIGAQGRQRADGSLDATVVQAGPKAGKAFGNGRNGPKASPSPSGGATG